MTNLEKEWFVCRPSQIDGIINWFDKKKQVVKMEDIFVVEKFWPGVYETSWQHGYSENKRSNLSETKEFVDT